jgi:hypothetical protein
MHLVTLQRSTFTIRHSINVATTSGMIVQSLKVRQLKTYAVESELKGDISRGDQSANRIAIKPFVTNLSQRHYFFVARP